MRGSAERAEFTSSSVKPRAGAAVAIQRWISAGRPERGAGGGGGIGEGGADGVAEIGENVGRGGVEIAQDIGAGAHAV